MNTSIMRISIAFHNHLLNDWPIVLSIHTGTDDAIPTYGHSCVSANFNQLLFNSNNYIITAHF